MEKLQAFQVIFFVVRAVVVVVVIIFEKLSIFCHPWCVLSSNALKCGILIYIEINLTKFVTLLN